MPPLQITEFAAAKVNLTLHVTGQRGDGYHLLDSLVVFCDVGDTVTVTPAPRLWLTITGPYAALLRDDGDNMVIRAARAMSAARGAAIVLHKRLPVASGIGGGSADAAATLRAVSRLWDVPLPDVGAVLALGADVPVCLAGRPARMLGMGDRITLVGGLPEMYIVLVNPGVEMPTPPVFGALTVKTNQPMSATLPQWPDAAAFSGWLATQRNDLEAPARALAPVIGTVLQALGCQKHVLIARMSGSGATCFALFASDAKAISAAQALRRAHPAWWVEAGQVQTGKSAVS